jgi:non-ribosomal peptide synthetase component F
MVEHRSAVNLVCSQSSIMKLSEKTRMLQFAPLGFDASIWEILGSLCNGAALFIPRGTKILDEVGSFIRQHALTHITLPPSVLHALHNSSHSFASVKVLVAAGEALLTSITLPLGDSTTIVNAYGPTEATVCATFGVVDGSEEVPSIGRPIANTRVYILDEHGSPVPVGVTGELYIGGAGVARGYLNRPDLTAERFLKDPFSAEANARMYRTGDLGRWRPDGKIDFVGRNDSQVKLRGFRIELGEIETALMTHHGVSVAVVNVWQRGAEDKRLVAYYICHPSATSVTPGVLREFLSKKLPEHMVPAAFVQLDTLPLTPNGKVDRKALPSPEASAFAAQAYEPPRGEMETAVASVWSELLHLDRVGRQDNFFHLGGHSLLAMSVVIQLRRCNIALNISHFFSSPVLCNLAAVAESTTEAAVPPSSILRNATRITPDMVAPFNIEQEDLDTIAESVPGGAANIQDIYPLTPLQTGFLFHHLLSPKGDPYVLSAQVSFKDRGALNQYIQALRWQIDRHDILRTAVQWESLEEPVQVVLREASIQVEEVDLNSCLEDVREEMHRTFSPLSFKMNLNEAPLLRMYVTYDAKRDEWLGQFLFHHLIGDHVTLDTMNEEIDRLLSGRADTLQPSSPFRNLVHLIRSGKTREDHESFFRSMLGDIYEPTLPFGLFDIYGTNETITEARIEVDEGFMGQLRSHAKGLSVSVASICHVAWARVIAQLAGQEDVVFGTVLLGRAQIAQGLGPFINTLPIRIKTGSVALEASIRHTHALVAGLMLHEHASLSDAQKCSQVAAPTPLFSSVLNYRHTMQTAPSILPSTGMRWLNEREYTNYPVSASVDDLTERMIITVQAPESVPPLRLCTYFRNALASIAQLLENEPNCPSSSVTILSEAERRQLLYEWNDTSAAFPENETASFPVRQRSSGGF